MLETSAIILIVLWLLGLVFSYTMAGIIHAHGDRDPRSPGSEAAGMIGARVRSVLLPIDRISIREATR